MASNAKRTPLAYARGMSASLAKRSFSMLRAAAFFLALILTTSAPGDVGCDAGLVDRLTSESSAGDRDAQFSLGRLYELGNCVSQDYSNAASLYQRSASQGSKEARHNLAKLYLAGLGVSKSPVRAVELLQRNVDEGFGPSMNSLGLLYLSANGVKRDISKGMSLLKVSSAKGVGDASFNLGEIYYFGKEGVAVDYGEALSWYVKAANAGVVTATLNVCEMYRVGRGTPQSATLARPWCRKAASAGEVKAQNIAGAIAYGMYPDVPPAYEEALFWWKQAAAKGNADAQFFMGMALEAGKAVPRDMSEARRWYRLAAQQGQEEALRRLEALDTK